MSNVTPDDHESCKSSYEDLVLGVWRILVLKDSPFLTIDFQWQSLSANASLFLHALYDVYTISPRLFGFSIAGHLWSAIEEPLSLYFSNRLFFLTEKRISGSLATDETPIDLYLAVMSKIACSVLSSYMRVFSQQNSYAFGSRIRYEFQARLFSAKLACDLQNAQELDTSKIDTDNVHYCLERGMVLVNQLVSLLLHLHLIIHLIGSSFKDGGAVFLAICMLPIVIGQFTPRDLWSKAYVVSPVNKFYLRKSALEKLSDANLRQEVMAGGANKYLMDEYRKAKDGLGDTPDTDPELLYNRTREALSDTIMGLCSDGPTLYFAFLALFSPSKLTIIQLALLNQTSTSLQYTFGSIRSAINIWPSMFSRMMNVYAALDSRNKMKDGALPFPRAGYETSAGMGIEIQNVSFSYPSTKSERSALTGVSFTIQPGQLVVIVGANGSGKSTVIKLLSRFYEPTSGRILIDGLPIEEYKMDELRMGIAMLTQEHQLFPLSVRENIRLGSSDAETMDGEEKIRESVLAAGAEGVIKNFANGYDTVLEPAARGYISYTGRGNKVLEATQKKLEKETSISGGEKQKLVASRTFMRLFTSPVKLVTVDEPSSALDPDAEYRLFTNLRQQRKGRTMIFVTHRFGHLTKHADLIICIKEGAVVETGTHAELLSRAGEYAHLYNVQAQAFATA